MGVALAVPGVIDVIIRGGEVVYEKINTFRKVDETMARYAFLPASRTTYSLLSDVSARFRETALDLKQGTLFFALTTLKRALNDRSVPTAVQIQLDRELQSIQKELDLSQEMINSVHEDRIKGRLTYAVWRGKGSKHQLDRQFGLLEQSCTGLKDLCLQLQHYQNSRSAYHLTSGVFKIYHETSDNEPGQELRDSEIRIVSGNYVRERKRVDAKFILEKKSLENDVQFLSWQLREENVAKSEGILPTLGYRQSPYNEPGE